MPLHDNIQACASSATRTDSSPHRQRITYCVRKDEGAQAVGRMLRNYGAFDDGRHSLTRR